MAIFWPKKWSQGPEKKKKKFFHFFICETPRRKKPPFYFFDFLFFCRFFGEKCQFFRVFSAKKAPSGRFMSTPPVPQVYHIDLSQKNGQKWIFYFCAPIQHTVLQVKAKKTVCITSKLFNIIFFGQGSVVTFLTLTLGKTVKLNISSFESYNF